MLVSMIEGNGCDAQGILAPAVIHGVADGTQNYQCNQKNINEKP